MSVIYMAVAVQPEGVGATIFKQGGNASVGAGTITLSLGKGELLRASYVPNPCGSRTDIGASLAQALAVREWFRTGPSVGGACVPEEFIVSSTAVTDHPAFVSALMMAWTSVDYSEAAIADAKRTKKGPGWFHVVRGPVSKGYGGPRTKKDLFASLASEEQAMVNADPMSAIVEAVTLGLLHLGRWKG